MLLLDIDASLLRFCADFADRHANMGVINFDANADESTLPQQDVVGISGVTVLADEGMCEVTVLFGISTREDTNLFRLNTYMAELFEDVLPTRRIKIYDANSGVQIGWMAVTNGTRALAVGGSSTRPLKYVMVNLLSSLAFDA